jgi:hypothetical protein
MRCPKCACNLLQKSGESLKVRVPILVFTDDGKQCVTSCPKCGDEIQLPITLNKSAVDEASVPLFISTERLTRKRIRP